MAFVANARPEQSDTHACSLNKGIGWESRTRNEAGSAAQTKQSGFPKVAVFLKYCFPCREICARWKPVIGRAVMAPREGWSNAFVRGKILCTWIDKSEDLQTPKRRIGSMAIASYPHPFRFRFGAKEIQDTKAMVITIIVFLIEKIIFILTGRREIEARRPTEAEERSLHTK